MVIGACIMHIGKSVKADPKKPVFILNEEGRGAIALGILLFTGLLISTNIIPFVLDPIERATFIQYLTSSESKHPFLWYPSNKIEKNINYD
jgi:hypothetical protein